MPGWYRTSSAAAYCDVSVRTVRRWIKKGLRHSRVGGSYLIKQEWLDEFLESHARNEGEQAEQLAAEMWKEVSQ